jgi:hypothetical protein
MEGKKTMKRITSHVQMSEWRKNGLRKYQIAENDYQPPLALKIEPEKSLKKYIWMITVNDICIGVYDSVIKAKDFIVKNFPEEFHNQDEFEVNEIPIMNYKTTSTVCLKKEVMNMFIYKN